MKIRYSIRTKRLVSLTSDNCKVGSEVIFVKGGKMEWESEDYTKELIIGNSYRVKTFLTSDCISVLENQWFLHTDHFKTYSHEN